jgi:hypothetical protein
MEFSSLLKNRGIITEHVLVRITASRKQTITAKKKYSREK